MLSAKQLGAEQIILMGRHRVRTELGRQFGASDVVAARGVASEDRAAAVGGKRRDDVAHAGGDPPLDQLLELQ